MKKDDINYFDIHSHLHSRFFHGDVQDILKQMREENIWTISVGVDFWDSEKAVEFAKDNENIFATIGWHPVDNPTGEFDTKKFQELLNKNKGKIIGVGECGLDYYWPRKDLEKGKISEADFAVEKIRQKELFEIQIDFAVKNNLPLMLHIRSFKDGDAHEDALDILDRKEKEFGKKIQANFHFFTESSWVVKEIIKRNYMISLPGVITFVNLNESIEKIPLENLMAETDSPFAAPVPFRGEINTPLYVNEIVKKIAEIKKEDLEKVKKQLIQNALNFWHIQEEKNR